MSRFDRFKKDKTATEDFNAYYGGFVVSKNICAGKKTKYAFREKSSIPQLNGWTLYSELDDQAYVNDSGNFVILSAQSLFRLCPVLQAIYEAPYGTDVALQYEKDDLIGFYDLKADRETTIEEILAKGQGGK